MRKTFVIGVDYEATALFFGRASAELVRLYEDNAGGLHLHQDGRLYAIDLGVPEGIFANDASSLSEGGVSVDGWHGQTAYDPHEMAETTRFIASYDPCAPHDKDDTPVWIVQINDNTIGSAGLEYLGLERE